MMYQPTLFPFRFHRLAEDQVVAISEAGDFAFLSQDELTQLVYAPRNMTLERQAELKAKYFLGEAGSCGQPHLLSSRLALRKEVVVSGPSLHLIVPTLQCEHTCRYCQVSRSLSADGFTMTEADLTHACDTIFESPSPSLTVEFQGGDPLIRFDLVRLAIEYITNRNRVERRRLRFVVTSTLHQLDANMCAFFKAYNVFLSTSIDGPRELHNSNRPIATRDAYERTLAGINLARDLIGPNAVAALMTSTQASLAQPEEIVDEYVRLGFTEIFLRTLSSHGFAKRNQRRVGYSMAQFNTFYERSFARILDWNRQGVPLREVSACLVFNKLLSPFDAGYVDLQSPSGAGLGALLYNYDGFVYPSDEARMMAETGDTSLRLGVIGTPLKTLLAGPVARSLVRSSLGRYIPGCRDCAFNPFCGPDPVGSQNQSGTMTMPVFRTEHCQRMTWLFSFLLRWLRGADRWSRELAETWGMPQNAEGAE